ncbi:hypothetical protein TEK04_17660 [Klenkia sp. LSe6-5]|uniref:N-acetyltransferase domain-containing protein n=1 Tax=Klenkia sesuvii TaxID=3103137 RepID=A0ABU8DXI5_9ACTN
MRVERLQTVPAELVDGFYALYADAFEPLRVLAAARHVLSPVEFAEEMADERIDKYVAFDDDGTAVGLTTFTGDLSSVPWIEPAYFAARHPEHAARDAIFYLGFTLTDPRAQRGRVFRATLQPIIDRMVAARGVVAFDICAHNDTVRHLSRGIERSMSAACEISMQPQDVQTYYSVECHGPKATTPAVAA